MGKTVIKIIGHGDQVKSIFEERRERPDDLGRNKNSRTARVSVVQ